LFGSKPRLRSKPNLNESCNGVQITLSSSVNYLGAVMDQNLSGESIAKSIISKSNSRFKFLYRKSKFLTIHTRKLLVMSLIQCHYDYVLFGIKVLHSYLKKLQTTQNKMVRFVLQMDNKSHAGHEKFSHLGWLPVSKRVDQIMLCHVHKVKMDLHQTILVNISNH